MNCEFCVSSKLQPLCFSPGVAKFAGEKCRNSTLHTLTRLTLFETYGYHSASTSSLVNTYNHIAFCLPHLHSKHPPRFLPEINAFQTNEISSEIVFLLPNVFLPSRVKCVVYAPPLPGPHSMLPKWVPGSLLLQDPSIADVCGYLGTYFSVCEIGNHQPRMILKPSGL